MVGMQGFFDKAGHYILYNLYLWLLLYQLHAVQERFLFQFLVPMGYAMQCMAGLCYAYQQFCSRENVFPIILVRVMFQ